MRGKFHVLATLSEWRRDKYFAAAKNRTFGRPAHSLFRLTCLGSPLFPLIITHTAENTQLSISICEQAAYINAYFPERIRDWIHDGLDDSKFDSSMYNRLSCVNSGFCCEVDENCTVLGYYAAGSVNSLPTLQDNLNPRIQDDFKILDPWRWDR